MLDLPEDVVEDLKKQIVTDDENAIREEFKFRKNAEKYPIMYSQRGADGLVDRTAVTYIALLSRSDVANMGSLLIQLQDGRWTRICSAYLNEMQADVSGVPEDQFDGDGLFS